MAKRQKSILIVEGNFALSEKLAQAVRVQFPAYDVRESRDIDDALAQVRRFQERQKRFALVVTEIKMPGMGGLELLDLLNAISPETKTIIMTACHSAELVERAQELNVYAYFIKPFIISEFRNVVQDALSYCSQCPE